jgi:hypothetical protein
MINRTMGIVGMAALLGVSLWGQSNAELDEKLENLEAKADEVVSVNLEGKVLALGQKLLSVHKEVGAGAKNLVKGLKGIYMRRFFFARNKSYSREDVAPIREKLEGDGWVQMIDVKDRRKTENVTVYSLTENEQLAGVTVLTEEPQEVTVVNIRGPVDLEALSTLGEQLSIPGMKLATTELPKKRMLEPGVAPSNLAPK